MTRLCIFYDYSDLSMSTIYVHTYISFSWHKFLTSLFFTQFIIFSLKLKRICFNLSLLFYFFFFGHSAQRLHALGDESKLLPLWRQVSPHFHFDFLIFFPSDVSIVLPKGCINVFYCLKLQWIWNFFLACRQNQDFFGTITYWKCSLIIRLDWWKFSCHLSSFTCNPCTLKFSLLTFIFSYLQLDPYLLPVIQGSILI